MKQTLPVLLFTTLIVSCGGRRSVYQSPDFDAANNQVRTIAVLPVQMIRTGHVGKNETQASIDAANERLGFAFQDMLYSFSADQTARNRRGHVVKFQSTRQTNSFFAQKGWNIDSIYVKSPETLAQMLGVDAVLMTTLNHNKNVCDGVAYGVNATCVVLATVTGGRVVTPGIQASDVRLSVSIYNGQTGNVLWKSFHNGGAEIPAHVDDVVQWYAHWIARRLPYRS